jgi:hypothetical protein
MKKEKIDWSMVTFEDAAKREQNLRAVLEVMGVPLARRDTRNLRTLKWLNRNIAASWGDHALAEAALDSVTWLLRWDARISVRR